MRTMAFLLAAFFWMAPAFGAQETDTEELRRAIRLHEIGSYAEALAVYKKLLQAEPNNAAILYEAGLTSKALGDLKACIAYATDAVATNQHLPVNLALLGSCQDDAGDQKAAIESFERGLAIAPTDSQLNFNYALTLARLGKVAESRKHAGISIESDPKRPTAYVLYAATLDVFKLDGAAALMRLRFLTLEAHTSRASDAAASIASRAAEYRKQSENKEVVLDGLKGSTKPDVPLVVLNLAFGLAVATEQKYVAPEATDAARFVNAMEHLLTVATELHENTPELAFVWKHAAAPLQEFSKDGVLQAFLYMVAGLAKLDGSREWLGDHPKEWEQLQTALRAARLKH